MGKRLAVRQRMLQGGLLVALALLGAGLLLTWAVEGQPEPAATTPADAPAPGAVAGLVTYTGRFTGTHVVWVGAFTTTEGGPPAYATLRSGPGPYTLTGLAQGVYYIMGGMDADDSGGAPDPRIDPISAYAHNPVTVTPGGLITGVDLILRDPGPPPPTGQGSISGRVDYSGRISPTQQIIVLASRQGEQGPPAYFTVIPAPGPYTLTGLAAYTYTVAAFMDTGNDMGPPQPGEPLGWYDANGDGQPDAVIVHADAPTPGINIVLRDPPLYLYLPLALRRHGP